MNPGSPPIPPAPDREAAPHPATSPEPPADAREPATPGGNELIPLTVRVRPETLRALRAAAAREGASPEAVAALWLEEHAAELGR